LMKKSKPERWENEKKAVKATQVAFDISTEAQKKLKLMASQNGLSPSDQMREILGLPRKKPVRPRLTISLTAKDYEILANIYKLDPEDKLAIKEQAAKEIIANVMKEEKQ
jgi:hypothetical protein